MICNKCQRQQICIPLLLSKNDPLLQKMLKGLKKCELRKVH